MSLIEVIDTYTLYADNSDCFFVRSKIAKSVY